MKDKRKRLLRIAKFYFLGLLVFCVLIISVDFYIQEISEEERNIEKIPEINLMAYSGEIIKIDELNGDIILLDFWFSRCAPCIEEMKYFAKILKKYDGQISIISFSSDSKEHTKEILESENERWSFLEVDNPNWIFCNSNPENKKSLIQLLGIKYYPTYFLIDKKGMVISKPKSGIYGVEKELNGKFTILNTLKKYLGSFEIFKLYFSLIIYTIIVGLFFLFKFLIKKLNKRI
jgi:cytochrome oxidase Cu insertion factor (SCO1/SenC/PrrC family)